MSSAERSSAERYGAERPTAAKPAAADPRAENPRADSQAPLQVESRVLSVKTVGEQVHLTLIADEVATRARPGTFVALRIGGETSSLSLRRAFWVHRVRPPGVYGGTVEVVFRVTGRATRWLAGRQPQDRVDLLGPVGRPFALPQEPVACAIVADGYGAAPMFLLAERLRERDCSVHLVLGAADERGLLDAREARRAAHSLTVTTLDGSVGIRGTVAKPLPALLARHQIDVVYAGGPVALLREVSGLAHAGGAWCQVAMEASMPCGVGLCQSCVLPVRGRDGVTRPARCCVDGPVFSGDRVDWALL